LLENHPTAVAGFGLNIGARRVYARNMTIKPGMQAPNVCIIIAIYATTEV
jgi:hypothetical protein